MPAFLNFILLEPAYLLLAAVLILLAWVAYLEWRLKRFMTGKNASNLEENFAALAADIAGTNRVNQEIQRHLINMEERLQKSVQHVKTVRFNPFSETGGNHSFATALLDERGNGTVISTLYSRDKTSVFAKPIRERSSEFELTAEEERAIAK